MRLQVQSSPLLPSPPCPPLCHPLASLLARCTRMWEATDTSSSTCASHAQRASKECPTELGIWVKGNTGNHRLVRMHVKVPYTCLAGGTRGGGHMRLHVRSPLPIPPPSPPPSNGLPPPPSAFTPPPPSSVYCLPPPSSRCHLLPPWSPLLPRLPSLSRSQTTHTPSHFAHAHATACEKQPNTSHLHVPRMHDAR